MNQPGPHQPIPGIHLGDYLAYEKYTSGQWIFDLAADGSLITDVRHKGIRTLIRKHRAIWVIANIRHGLPIDASLEIDHINHNKTDCRIRNLRLVTHLQNERAKPAALPSETVRQIRIAYAEGGVTQKQLSWQFGISPHAVSRIVRNITYTEVNP